MLDNRDKKNSLYFVVETHTGKAFDVLSLQTSLCSPETAMTGPNDTLQLFCTVFSCACCGGARIPPVQMRHHGISAVARWRNGRLAVKYGTPSGDVVNDVWRQVAALAKSTQLLNQAAPFA